MKQNNMRIIGLTGNIGSGKSSVSGILAQNGGYIIDTDKLAHAVIEPGREAYNEVLSFFGAGILRDGGETAELPPIDRKKLGRIVFDDKEKLNRLMDITYKHITRETCEQIRQYSEMPSLYSFIVVDAPMLLESGLETRCGEIWVVMADDSVRLGRILQRGGLTKEEALKRMANQKPSGELLECAARRAVELDIPVRVIDNNGNLSLLEEAVCGWLYNSSK